MPKTALSRAEIEPIYADYLRRTDMTAREIAAAHYMCYATMCQYFRRYGMPMVRHTDAAHRAGRRVELDHDTILRMYDQYCHRFDESAIDVAADYGVPYKTMLAYFKRYNLPLKRINQRKRSKLSPATCDLIIRLRAQQHMTYRAIAAHTGYNQSTIYKMLQQRGTP